MAAKIKRNRLWSVPPIGDPEEIDRIIDESGEIEFNPVKSENEELPKPEQEGGIKKTVAFDNARLEYMRMQIGPVQNFYRTLGNILLSFDERLRRLEEEHASKKL